VGVALLVAPWWSFLWEANWLLPPNSLVRSLVLSPFTRGAVSGLGIVNILLAIHDAHARLAHAARPRADHSQADHLR